MSTKGLQDLNSKMMRFVKEHKSDEIVVTLQTSITSMAKLSANTKLPFSQRITATEIAQEFLDLLVDYIAQEYPEDYKDLIRV